MLLYESASGMHGRRKALQGDEYTNIFFHFNNPEWRPMVVPIVRHKWRARRDYERAVGKRFTTYADAGSTARRWDDNTPCHRLRNRTDALLVAGGFADPPLEAGFVASRLTPSTHFDAAQPMKDP